MNKTFISEHRHKVHNSKWRVVWRMSHPPILPKRHEYMPFTIKPSLDPEYQLRQAELNRLFTENIDDSPENKTVEWTRCKFRYCMTCKKVVKYKKCYACGSNTVLTRLGRKTGENMIHPVTRQEEFITDELIDQDPMNQDRLLFQVDYAEDGEAGLGIANKVRNMTGLNRLIFEDGHCANGTVQRKNLNVPQVGKNKCIHELSKALRCTLDQAEDLMFFWNIIDDSGRIWPEFKKWTLKGGIDKALAYFENMAGELVDDEIVNETEFVLSTEFIDEYTPSVLDIVNPQHEIDIDENLFDQFMDRKGWETEAGAWHSDRGFPAPEEFRYAVINYDLTVDTQSDRLTQILKDILNMDLVAVKQTLQFLYKGQLKDGMLQFSNKEKTRLYAALNERKIELLAIKKAWVEDRLKQLNQIERETLAKFKSVKSAKQAKYFWMLIFKQPDQLGRADFVEHILKDVLNLKQQELTSSPPESLPPAPEYDAAYLA